MPNWSALAVSLVVGTAVALGVRLVFGIPLYGGAAYGAFVGAKTYPMFLDWIRKRAPKPADSQLQGAAPVPLAIEHPYLQVRATITGGGRVTILVDGVVRDLSIGARGVFTLGAIDQKTGDADFDANVRVTGNSLTSRSLLDAATRDAIRAALRRFPRMTVNAGIVEWSGRPVSVESAARELLELASRLLPPDLLAGLEKSALTDPAPEMRLRALELLCGRFRGAPETRSIATSALADAEPSIRLRAALFLGPVGHDELATLAANEALSANLRAEAVRGTVQLPVERAAEIVRDALTDRRETVRRSAIHAVQRMKLANCNDRLGVLVRRATPQQQLAIVEAAAATEHFSAEVPLLAALEVGPPDVQLAAIRALGPLGTIRSVEPLLAMRGTQIMLGKLGPAAGEAVAAIQARLAGAGAGQLALSEPATGGQISFPGAERGSLSVPPSPPGELSLSPEEVQGVRGDSAARKRTT